MSAIDLIERLIVSASKLEKDSPEQTAGYKELIVALLTVAPQLLSLSRIGLLIHACGSDCLDDEDLSFLNTSVTQLSEARW